MNESEQFEQQMIEEELDRKADARSYNVGKSDYARHRIQPYDIWSEYKLDPWRADIIKRVLRTKAEPGMTIHESKLLDLRKIQHIVTHMIELYEENKFPWEDK